MREAVAEHRRKPARKGASTVANPATMNDPMNATTAAPLTALSALPGSVTGRAETPVSFVNAILAAYASRGINPAAMLKQAQIAPAILKKAGGRITALQFELASGLAMRELDDEALGWFERPLPWGSYGMLVRASLTAPTLGVALKRWCRHHNLLTSSIQLGLT